VVLKSNIASGILNSGQYCYFSSLIQCLSINLDVRQSLEEHLEAVEEDDSKFENCHMLFFTEKYVFSGPPKIP